MIEDLDIGRIAVGGLDIHFKHVNDIFNFNRLLYPVSKA